MIKDVTPGDRRRLEAFLARPDHPDDTLSFGKLMGFLFTLACAPDMVPPSEWLPVVFGGAEPSFEDEDEASEIMGILFGLYNEVNQAVSDMEGLLPEECALRDDPMANLEPDAPVSEWCSGFVLGHMWLEDSWDVPMGEENEQERDSCLAILSFFTSRDLAERFWREMAKPGKSFESTVATYHRLFPDALVSYAMLGRSIFQALRNLEERRGGPAGPARSEPVPGRNDPCPCGSGRKFKKCCGRQVH